MTLETEKKPNITDRHGRVEAIVEAKEKENPKLWLSYNQAIIHE